MHLRHFQLLMELQIYVLKKNYEKKNCWRLHDHSPLETIRNYSCEKNIICFYITFTSEALIKRQRNDDGHTYAMKRFVYGSDSQTIYKKPVTFLIIYWTGYELFWDFDSHHFINERYWNMFQYSAMTLDFAFHFILL